MDVEIFAEFNNDKVTLKLSLPLDFIEKNADEYINLENKVIYQSSKLTINHEVLNNNLDALLIKIKNIFYDENFVIVDKKINIHILDSENNKIAFNFIKNNKDLNIVMAISDFKEITDILKDGEYPNFKIRFKNSEDLISYKDFYKMYNKLNEIIKFVNYYNLSPLEKIMLIYDIVKSNEYRKENSNESYGASRNLNEIINNDKIVCVGFSNLMDFLLKNLNIQSNTMIIGYTDKKSLHERNFLYLKDEKYNIDGLFFLDATWDSKKNEEYLDNYTFFLRGFNFFKNFKPAEYIITPTKFQILEKNEKELEEYINGFKNSDFIRLSITLSQLIKEYDPSVGFIINLQDKSVKEIINIIVKIQKKYNKKISENAFKNALYRVRKIEYINGILKKELTEEDINKAYNNYYKYNPEIKLLKALNLYEEPTLDSDLEISKAKTVEEDLLRMRLLKALKEKINDKPENDYIKKM